jgi:hypothetical protein
MVSCIFLLWDGGFLISAKDFFFDRRWSAINFGLLQLVSNHRSVLLFFPISSSIHAAAAASTPMLAQVTTQPASSEGGEQLINNKQLDRLMRRWRAFSLGPAWSRVWRHAHVPPMWFCLIVFPHGCSGS